MAEALTIRLEDETLSALDRLAGKTDRPRDLLVVRAIEDFLALESWRIEKIEAGIAAADRGEFASDEEVARVKAKFQTPE